MRPIDADALVEAIKDYPYGFRVMIVCDIAKQPTIDAVPVGAYEQTRWERDMAIAQLAEIGKSLCEKMDNVATVVRCKDCKYYDESVMFSPQKMCFRLKDKNCKVIGYNFAEDDFCSYGERREDE